MLAHLRGGAGQGPTACLRVGAQAGDALPSVLLDVLDDAGHGAHGLDGVGAHGGLTGEHDGVGAVENGVGAVGGLSPCGPRVLDHGLQDLGGHDDRLGLAAGQLDGAFLHQRDGLQGHFHTEVTTGDHDAVEGGDDVEEVLHRLGLLDLGDDRDAHADLVHDLVDVLDVIGVAHEGQGDEVSTDLEGPAQVLTVLLAQGRHGDGNAGQVDALVVGDVAGHLDLGDDVGVGDGHDTYRDVAVVDEEPVAGAAVAGKSLEGGGGTLDGAQDVVNGDGELVALVEHDLLVVYETSQSDLGALEVDEDGDGSAGSGCGLTDAADDLFLVLGATVGAVDARDVHAGVHERLHLLGRVSSGSEGTYDLGSTHGFRIRDTGPCARGGISSVVRLRPSSPTWLPPECQAVPRFGRYESSWSGRADSAAAGSAGAASSGESGSAEPSSAELSSAESSSSAAEPPFLALCPGLSMASLRGRREERTSPMAPTRKMTMEVHTFSRRPRTVSASSMRSISIHTRPAV